MTAYADFTYYDETFLGVVIAETDFPRLALRASEQIDRITYQRAAGDTDNTNAIKMAMCAVAEKYQAIENGGAGGIKTEKIGDNSVTYSDNSVMTQPAEIQFQNAAQVYLGSTGLMFAGFIDGEYAD